MVTQRRSGAGRELDPADGEPLEASSSSSPAPGKFLHGELESGLKLEDTCEVVQTHPNEPSDKTVIFPSSLLACSNNVFVLVLVCGSLLPS